MNAVIPRVSIMPTVLRRFYCLCDRHEETVATLRARLLYQSRKRGMLENDLLLSHFAAESLNDFNEEQLRKYDKLINRTTTNEWDLYHWCIGKLEPPEEVKNCEIFKKLASHAKNVKKQQRFQMPPLSSL